MRWAAALLLMGCRFGGPGAAPQVMVGDAAADAADVHADAHADADGPDDANAGEAADAAMSCGAAVCDPVCNTGCPALSRCDVGEGTRTGTCVGIWITEEGGSCFKGSGTDSCAVHLTCFGGTCRRLCYADGDCGAGTCCNTPLPAGFMVCSPCARP